MYRTSLRTIWIAVLFLFAAGLLGGCANQEVRTQRYFFPRLPERPRYEWLASYQGESDFTKKGFGAFMENVVGKIDSTALEKPLDIKVSDDQKVFVADHGLHGVVIFDLVNQNVHMLGGEKYRDEFVRPTNLTLDDQGNVYVVDPDRKMIFVIDKNEQMVRQISFGDLLKSGGGMVFDRVNKRLICTDIQGNKIVMLSPDGKHLGSIGVAGEKDGEFNRPSVVALTSKGEIVVGDMMNGRIQIFGSDGKFIRKFGNRGDSPGEFQLMKGVAVDSEDHVYVTDGKGNKVEIFSSTGDYLLSFGTRGSVVETGRSLPFGFLLPQGIAIDRNDRLYIVDSLNYRFQVIQYLSDDFIRKNPIPGLVVK